MSDDARNAVKCHQLRKIHSHSTARHPKYKDYYKARPCPVEGCTCVVTRLASHLRFHKIHQRSPLYRELLRAARKTSRSTRSRNTASTSGVKNRDVAASDVLNGNTGDMECSDDDDAQAVNDAEMHNAAGLRSVNCLHFESGGGEICTFQGAQSSSKCY